MLRLARSRFRPAGISASALVFLLAGCGGAPLETFPSLVRTGVTVQDERTQAYLDDAVREYVDVHGLPVEQGNLVSGRLTTEWFPLESLDPALARCPEARGAAPAEGDRYETPRFRARYRFTLLPRAGQTLLRVEAHWQREASGPAFETDGAWVDCPSTGEWERATEERLVMRASLMPMGE